MVGFFRKPLLALGVAGWFFTFNSVPAIAGLVDSKPASEAINLSREEEIAKIQRVLESKELQES